MNRFSGALLACLLFLSAPASAGDGNGAEVTRDDDGKVSRVAPPASERAYERAGENAQTDTAVSAVANPQSEPPPPPPPPPPPASPIRARDLASYATSITVQEAQALATGSPLGWTLRGFLDDGSWGQDLGSLHTSTTFCGSFGNPPVESLSQSDGWWFCNYAPLAQDVRLAIFFQGFIPTPGETVTLQLVGPNGAFSYTVVAPAGVLNSNTLHYLGDNGLYKDFALTQPY